jgi:YD repeat-containing protein
MRLLIACVLFVLPFAASSQTASYNSVSFQTPNAAGLGLYTDVPVSKYTGIPDITIPIYEVVSGDVRVPIFLNYHPASVRVHSHPSWVGLGWNLVVGGAITRSTYGAIDERTRKFDNLPLGFYGNYSKLAGTDTEWCSATRLEQYRNEFYPQFTMIDSQPDEFSFNFLGYSGTFYMGHDGQWKVISSQQIKVEFDPTMGQGFIAENQMRSMVWDRLNEMSSEFRSEYSGRYFNKFILVTPDGLRYEFGGAAATEYSVPYYGQSYAGPEPVTWFLSKITSPSGREVNFTYEQGKLITSLQRYYSETVVDRGDDYGFFERVLRGFTDPTGALEPYCGYSQSTPGWKYAGSLLFPVYLRTITSSTTMVDFYSGASTQLRYPTDAEIDSDSHPQLYFAKNTSSYGAQREWRKLSAIQVQDKASGTELWSWGEVCKYEFTYSNDATKRLRLEKLQLKRDHALEPPPYLFTYNPRYLPDYSEYRSHDHWDFYNGLDPSLFSSNVSSGYYNSRQPDQTGEYMKAEVLEQIQYPTGGAVRFEFEPHTYSKMVDRNVTTLPVINYGFNKVAGGLRIKSISHYQNLADNKPASIREYYYTSDYYPGNNPNDFISSGILASDAKYYWRNYQGTDAGGVDYTYSVFSSGNLLPFGLNVPGAHVGYSEVVEVLKNREGVIGGYTKNKYSNFDADIWAVDHRDEIGITTDPARSIYSPISSHDRQRGKVLAEEFYHQSAFQPLKVVKYQYAKSSTGYVRRLFLEHFNICSHITAGAQAVYVTAFKSYDYRYNLISKQTTEYDGSNTFTTTENFTYTTQNFLRTSTVSTSEGATLETGHKYPLDYTTNSSITSGDWQSLGISKLVNKNITGVPIETVRKRNGVALSASLSGYKVFGDKPFLHYQWNMETDVPLNVGVTISNNVGLETYNFNPSALRLTSGVYNFAKDEHYTAHPFIVNNYDAFGNVLELYTAEDVRKCYVWSYVNTRPILEFVGVSYAEVQSAAQALGLNLTTIGQSVFTTAQLHTYFQQFRNQLPQAQIIGYTYNGHGITSKVDTNGQVTTYEYDYLGKLLSIKDNSGHIIQSFKYHYSGEN